MFKKIHWKGLILTLVVLIFLIVGISIGVWFGRAASGESDYSAVYMNTGDMYFGKLSWWPQPHLTDVWLLQRGVDSKNQPQTAVAPFKNAFWSPAGVVYLNRQNIVWWAPVAAGTNFDKALSGTLPQSDYQQAPTGTSPGPASTSTPSSAPSATP